ncbi:MAG: hypothetical protein JXQ65_04510 [Candidatus Marinimicrobia bacterium]|nr:hypothetical protein [Candidatus Neomarinimicrobiota bacterium]
MKKIVFLLAVLLTFCFAQSHLNAPGIAYLFSNSAVVEGWETIGTNPANLGFYFDDSLTVSSLNIGFLPMVSVPAVNFGNNAFSYSLLMKDFFHGGKLSVKNKNNLLDAVSSNGVNGHFQMTQNILKYSRNNIAFGLSLESLGETQLPKSFINFGLNGNQFDQLIHIDDLDGEALLYSNFNFYLGHRFKKDFYKKYFKELYWGIGVDLILGGIYQDIEKMDGYITSRTDALEISGKARSRVGTGGLGFALDLGLTGKIDDNFYTSITLQNPISLIRWGVFDMIKIDGKNTQVYEYDYYLELESEEFFSDAIDSLLDAAVQTDSSYTGKKFNSHLPASYNLSASYQFSEKFKINAAVYGYFSNKFGLDFVPKISTVVTYNPNQAWPLILGLGTGKFNQFTWSLGTGIHKGRYHLDLGFSQYGGLFNYSRGFYFALDQSFYF